MWLFIDGSSRLADRKFVFLVSSTISIAELMFALKLFMKGVLLFVLYTCRYNNGEIRLYQLSTGRLLGDIGAHARAINAIHIAQGSGLVGISLFSQLKC